MQEEQNKYISINYPVPFEVSQVTLAEKPMNNESTDGFFNVEYEYSNGLGVPVTVVTRQGLRVELPSSNNPRKSDFVVRVRVTMGKGVNVNIDDLLNSSSSGSRTTGEVIRSGGVEERFGRIRYELDYRVAQKEITDLGGSLYLSNLDIVVTTVQGHRGSKHPFSDVGVRNQMVEESEKVNCPGHFSYSLRIIDSNTRYGARYVNINGEVYKVPAERSSYKIDGVYLITSGPVAGDVNNPKPVCERYEFEEAEEKLRLYKTAEEARTFGDELSERKKELSELTLTLKEKEQKLRNERLERDFNYEQSRHELMREREEEETKRKDAEARSQARMVELKEEIAELEHRRNTENIRQKREYEEQKSAYDQRSMERKDNHEIVKFIPAVITGVAAIFIAFSKLST